MVVDWYKFRRSTLCGSHPAPAGPRLERGTIGVMRLGLDGKVFVVTAASSGLGLATARALVAEGSGVLVVARDAERLDRVVSTLGGSQQAIGLPADLSDPQTADRAARVALESFGRLDGAFINAGVPPRGTVLDIEEQTWQEAFDSIFLAALRVARATLAVNRAARLGFLLSASVKSPLTGSAVANGLRPGMAMLVKQLADEIGPDGGRAFGLLPGSIGTQRLTEQAGSADNPAAARRATLAGIPLRRFGEPDELGRVAAFLFSDAASYITGCVIPVDGGALRAL